MFNDIVDYMAYGALVFSVVEIYLMLNKLWSRKHIRDVAESISVSSRVVGLIPLSIFTLNYALEHQWQGVIEGLMWLFAGLVQLLIGVGFWISGNKRLGFLELFRKSIKSEKTEVAYLARTIFKPHSQEKIIDILTGIALIDDKLDAREKVYIEHLAAEWNIRIFWGAAKARHKKAVISPFFNLWEDLNEYLEHRPSKSELKVLRETVAELVAIDGQLSEQETIVMNEFDYLIDHVDDEASQAQYQVAIVPQTIEQDHYLSTHFGSLTRQEMEGGSAYVTRAFFSDRYAQQVKSQFQENGYFTTVTSGL